MTQSNLFSACEMPRTHYRFSDPDPSAPLVREGMQTPWGRADHAEMFLPGMGSVSTPGHGGVKLSAERNRLIPEDARRPGGWYEEDCDCNIPFTVFLDEIMADGSPAPKWLRTALVKYPPGPTWGEWFPDSYARYIGRELRPEESHVLRQRLFDKEHAADYVVLAAWGSWQPGVPDGMVGVVATLGGRRDGTTARKWFLVPDAEYSARTGEMCGFVIDLRRHVEVEDFTETGADTKRERS